MKRLFWVESLVLVVVMLICSCRSTAGTDHDQIVKSAIDLAQTYVASQDYDKAIAVYTKALSQADDYRLYYNYALALSQNGQNTLAATICDNAFERYPYIIDLKKAQAIYYRLDGDIEKSNESYLRILELDPYDRDTRLVLIRQYEEANEIQKAYEMALVMWNQGYKDKTTIEILYRIEPQLWSNVYHQIVK